MTPGETTGAWARARRAAYGPGEFVDQQGFMLARDIRSLAVRAEIGSGTRVLDLCCGRGGPGRLITRELGCHYLGVDADPEAIALARERVDDLPCRYVVARVPPVPAGPVDVVLLLETLLAFPDKEALLREIRAALAPGGRFACTVEEGPALTPDERAAMPAAGTVWPIPLTDLRLLLGRVGLEVQWIEDVSDAHADVAEALVRAVLDERALTTGQADSAVEQLLAGHRLWVRWLRSGRVRKFALVAG